MSVFAPRLHTDPHAAPRPADGVPPRHRHRRRLPSQGQAPAPRREGTRIDEEHLWRLLTRAIIGALVGARFVRPQPPGRLHRSTLEALRVWEGGASLLGGIAFARYWRPSPRCDVNASTWTVMDAAAPGLALGIAIGRVGDRLMGDHLGKPTDFLLGYRCTGADVTVQRSRRPGRAPAGPLRPGLQLALLGSYVAPAPPTVHRVAVPDLRPMVRRRPGCRGLLPHDDGLFLTSSQWAATVAVLTAVVLLVTVDPAWHPAAGTGPARSYGAVSERRSPGAVRQRRAGRRSSETSSFRTLADTRLGDDVLEVGPGPGMTTDLLRVDLVRLTAVELGRDLAEALPPAWLRTNVEVVRRHHDALRRRPLQAVSFTMLHTSTPTCRTACSRRSPRCSVPEGSSLPPTALPAPSCRSSTSMTSTTPSIPPPSKSACSARDCRCPVQRVRLGCACLEPAA